MKKAEKFWAIHGEFGFYCGTFIMRKEAIEAHTAALGKDWAYCYAKGDRAVKVLISPMKP